MVIKIESLKSNVHRELQSRGSQTLTRFEGEILLYDWQLILAATESEADYAQSNI